MTSDGWTNKQDTNIAVKQRRCTNTNQPNRVNSIVFIRFQNNQKKPNTLINQYVCMHIAKRRTGEQITQNIRKVITSRITHIAKDTHFLSISNYFFISSNTFFFNFDFFHKIKTECIQITKKVHSEVIKDWNTSLQQKIFAYVQTIFRTYNIISQKWWRWRLTK